MKVRKVKVSLPKNKYFSKFEVNDDGLTVEMKHKKRIALLFVCLNDLYWPYVIQAVKDSKKHFLPHHNVDYFVWTDMHRFQETRDGIVKLAEEITGTTRERAAKAVDFAVKTIFYYQLYSGTNQFVQDMEKMGISFRVDQAKGIAWIESKVNQDDENQVNQFVDLLKSVCFSIIRSAEQEVEDFRKLVNIVESDPAEWPAPTLMRYHLFLNEEEKLKKYDYVFYMDADMKVVQKISDEILGEGLTAAPHPGYAINKRMIPPYEPNPESTAYIHRLGQLVEEEPGKKRFYPFYAAGGFQGGKSKLFLKSMKSMKKNINTDFDEKNYTAIWNDESHWNKYLWEFQKKGGDITFLDVSYIYPDSLIKEFYNNLWGKEYEPKIITLTKPWSVSKQGGQELSEFIKPQ